MTSDPLVPVFATGDITILTLAKAVLDQAGIHYLIKGEYLQNTLGIGSFALGYNPIAGPMLIEVLAADADRAHEMLDPLTQP